MKEKSDEHGKELVSAVIVSIFSYFRFLLEMVVETKKHLEKAGETEIIINYLKKSKKAMTRREIVRDTAVMMTSSCAVIRELLNDGIIEAKGSRKCAVTGQRAEVFGIKKGARKIKKC